MPKQSFNVVIRDCRSFVESATQMRARPDGVGAATPYRDAAI